MDSGSTVTVVLGGLGLAWLGLFSMYWLACIGVQARMQQSCEFEVHSATAD
jgi:hypothetical protein